ncbi:MAG: rod shape-determining protein MreD [Azoarcus sp.]|jgi:rod shape-determining protein MreD|nr:rod shape-determining protein MreD [Azoarcus sp.]
MQLTNRSNRILLPVRVWFVYLSLVIALGLDYIPTSRIPGIPDWVALVLAFWCIREPRVIGMGAGFVLGVLIDIGQGAAMGQHALAYVVLAWFAGELSRRIMWFPALLQALHVLPMLLIAQALMVAVRMVAGNEFPGWWYFISSFTGVLLWWPLTYLLLLPQFQPVERDENRPI